MKCPECKYTNSYFGKAMKDKRHELKLTQRALAKAVGISNALICNYENQGVSPSFENAALIARHLGLDLNEIAKGYS